MASFKDFKTRSAANEGRKMPILSPDGTESDQWLLVRGVESDAARQARDESNRAMMIAADTDDLESLRESMRLDMISALIADWSFDEPCNKENVLEFLADYPAVSDAADRFAVNRKVFFGKEPTNSASGQKAGSGSKAPTEAV